MTGFTHFNQDGEAIMVFGLLGYASMWAAVFADTGVAILCILNSIRILYKKY